MPVVAAAAAAVFSSAVTFATAVGTAALTSVGLGSLATMGIASFTGSLTIGAVVGAVSIGSTAMSIFSMARKPKASAGSPSPLAFKADPNAFLSYVAGGPVGVGGNQVFGQTSASKNKYLTYVTALSAGGPVHSVQPFKANDTVVTFGADGGAGAVGTYSKRMWQKFGLGAVIGATALTMANVTGNRDTPGNNGGHPYEWTPQHTLPSIAHSMWTLLSDPDKYPQLPKPLWEVRGGPVYDPRKDSTFPGGNGPQRWNDRNTWSTEGNQNPFLQALTFGIGHIFNGVRLGGVGLPITAIDVPSFVYAANVADANGWKIAWVWHTGMRKWDVLTTMMQAGGGTPLVRGSKLSCMVEAPRVSIGVITDEDIKGAFSITGSANQRERKNTIIPRCKSAAHKWTVQPFGAVTAQTYLDEDGDERPEEIEYESIADNGDGGRQLRQIAAYDLANMREGLGGTLPLPMKFMKYRAGDCLTVNAPSTLLNGQKVVILKREVDTKSRRVNLTVRSETDGKHDFALGRTANAPPSPNLTGVDPTVVEPPAPDAWAIEPGQTPGGGGSGGGMPIVVIVPANPDPDNPGGAHGDDPAATNVVVRYRKEGTDPATGEPWPWVQEEFPATSPKIELKGLAPLTTYEVELAYRVRGIVGLWQPYGLVTTQSLIATNALALGNRDAQDILDGLDAVPALIAAAIGQLDASVGVAIGNINAALGQLDDAVEAIEVDLNDPASGLKVRVGSVETVAANAASRVAALEVTVDTAGTGLKARTASLETATANLQTGKADASRVEVVEADLNTAGTGLKARTASLETATANLQTGKADASRVTLLEASTRANINRVKNPTARRGIQNWTPAAGRWQAYDDPFQTPYFFAYSGTGAGQHLYMTTSAADRIPVQPGLPYTLQAERALWGRGGVVTGGVTLGEIYWYDAGGTHFATINVGGATALSLVNLGWVPFTGTYTAPAGAAFAAVTIGVYDITTTGTVEAAFRRVKFEGGSAATMWTDDAESAVLNARATSLENAVVDLAAGKADASRVSAVEVDLNTPGTGLKARTGSLETATANLQTGKADASRVTTLEAQVKTAGVPNGLPNPAFGPTHLNAGPGPWGEPVGASLTGGPAQNCPVGWTEGWNGPTGQPCWRGTNYNSGGLVFGGKMNVAYAVTKNVADTTDIQIFDINQADLTVKDGKPLFLVPCAPGDRVYGRFLGSGHRCQQGLLFSWYGKDANGNLAYAGETFMGWRPDANNYNGFNGDPANFVEIAGTTTVPSNLGIRPQWFSIIARSLVKADPSYYAISLWAQPIACVVPPGVDKVPYNEGGDASTFSRITTAETATADLYGRTRARWSLGLAVPGADAFMQAQAEVTAGQAPTSSVAIGAKQIALYNQIGDNWLKALEVVGGNAILTGGLQAGAFIRLGNGNGWPVALKPVDFNVSDGEVVSFGTDLGALPILAFAQNNLAPLNAGETYDIRAVNLTATGFTMSAKISVPATPSSQTVGAGGYNESIAGYPGVTRYMDGKPNSADGTYQLKISGSQQHRIIPSGGGAIIADNEDYQTVELRLYAYNGSWQLVATLYASSVSDPDQYFGDQHRPITVTETFYFYDTVTLPANTTHINVGCVGASNGMGGSVGVVGPINWQSQGTGAGQRSATPNGQKTKVTVRPQ